MPFALQDLLKARRAYLEFLQAHDKGALHSRYIFPLFAGSYFAYRKLDVMRIVAVARAVGEKYVDFGCGHGDFLARVREFIPEARGVEAQEAIFSLIQAPKPEYIEISPVELFDDRTDVAFVGWMEPGQDFRRQVSKSASCIITTFDAGGQCGVNGACEYDEFGFIPIATWRTPSWIDVNAELMNRYYTPGLSDEAKKRLASARTAHNLWQVYARKEIAGIVRDVLHRHVQNEQDEIQRLEPYNFERILDECGFGYMEELAGLTRDRKLWQVRFEY